jgi:hypothetical protein
MHTKFQLADDIGSTGVGGITILKVEFGNTGLEGVEWIHVAQVIVQFMILISAKIIGYIKAWKYLTT